MITSAVTLPAKDGVEQQTNQFAGNTEKRQVMAPSYIPEIAKVQVYCAWAQVLLGEASFRSPVK